VVFADPRERPIKKAIVAQDGREEVFSVAVDISSLPAQPFSFLCFCRHLKAVSGIKSLKALEAYLGYDQEAQDEAMEISE